eukprot:757947-Hanusia_phi.AAC.1
MLQHKRRRRRTSSLTSTAQQTQTANSPAKDKLVGSHPYPLLPHSFSDVCLNSDSRLLNRCSSIGYCIVANATTSTSRWMIVVVILCSLAFLVVFLVALWHYLSMKEEQRFREFIRRRMERSEATQDFPSSSDCPARNRKRKEQEQEQEQGLPRFREQEAVRVEGTIGEKDESKRRRRRRRMRGGVVGSGGRGDVMEEEEEEEG